MCFSASISIIISLSLGCNVRVMYGKTGRARTVASLLSAALATVLVSACSEKPAPAVNTPSVAVDATPRAPAPGDSLCPRDGLWKECALVDRIVHAGLFFKAANDTMVVKYLQPKGIKYQVGLSASLIAFYYPDTIALLNDWKTLDTLRLTPVGDSVGAWPTRPGDVIRSSNLVAVFFSNDLLQRERMRLAITAGAPQPPSAPMPQLLPPSTSH